MLWSVIRQKLNVLTKNNGQAEMSCINTDPLILQAIWRKGYAD